MPELLPDAVRTADNDPPRASDDVAAADAGYVDDDEATPAAGNDAGVTNAKAAPQGAGGAENASKPGASAFSPEPPPHAKPPATAIEAAESDVVSPAAQAAAGNTLVSDTELETALAEIELLCAGTREQPEAEASIELPATAPDYEPPPPQEPRAAEAPLPAPTSHAPPASDEPTPEPAEDKPPTEAAAPPAPTPPPPKKVRFKIGKPEPEPTPESKAPADNAPDAQPAAPAAAARAPAPVVEAAAAPVAVAAPPPSKRLYRLLDGLLDLINRPFVKMPSRLRDLVGGVAIATIGTSFMMPVILMQFMAKRDAVSFLQQLRYEFENPPPAAEAAEAGGGHGAAKGDHGKKPDAKKDAGHGKSDAKKDGGHGKADAKKDAGHGKKPDAKKSDGHGKKADEKKKSGGH